MTACLAAALVLLVAPLSAAAQPAGKVHWIGFLSSGSSTTAPSPVHEGFRHALRDLGWIEGQNVVVDYRFADGHDRLPAHAADLVRLKVDIIVALATPAIAAAKSATATIPIVMIGPGDPVGSGFVASLARPGGNVTGTGGQFPGIHIKMLELLKETVPRASRIGVVWNSTFSLHVSHIREVEQAAPVLGLVSERVDVRTPADLDGVFAAMVQRRQDAALVLSQPLVAFHHARVAKLAADHRLPAIYGFEEVVQAGGLISYGPRGIDAIRRLPYYLTINAKAAKALGLVLSPSLLLRADHVIDQ